MVEDLTIGQEYSNEELMATFKCANASGMRRSHETNTLVLIADHTKSLFSDYWDGDIFYYVGQGSTGDQSLTYNQNRTLSESNQSGIRLVLFEVFERGRYLYHGDVVLNSEPFQEEQLDQNNKPRKVWVFPLKLLNEKQEIPEQIYKKKETYQEILAKKLSDYDLKMRLSDVKPKSHKRSVVSQQFDRNQLVVEYAKRKAKGICQLCGEKAPFSVKAQPFLEVHHIEWLSKGGKDTIENVVALCPNCHRKMHLVDSKKDVEYLKKIAKSKTDL